MVGAQIEGFTTMVDLNHDTEIAIFEGDEYLSSPIDRRPKFHLYKPHIAVLTGIAWDHINVFPTFSNYVEQFDIFANMIEKSGHLYYFDGDKELQTIAHSLSADIHTQAYNTFPHKIEKGTTFLHQEGNSWPISLFGEHNLQNISAAYLVCKELGLNDKEFFKPLSYFSGASKRLQVLAQSDDTTIFLDFAHSPSKLKATTQAVSDQFPERELIACMELHTFSSLKRDFLPEYKDSMKSADQAFVYFNPEVLEHKKLESISKEDVASGFASDNVVIFDNSDALLRRLKTLDLHKKNLLLMSSGNFNGVDFPEFANSLIHNKINDR